MYLKYKFSAFVLLSIIFGFLLLFLTKYRTCEIVKKIYFAHSLQKNMATTKRIMVNSLKFNTRQNYRRYVGRTNHKKKKLHGDLKLQFTFA